MSDTEDGFYLQIKTRREMSHDEKIRLAKEAGFPDGDLSMWPEHMVHFAYLVVPTVAEKEEK